jgi:hypothetical protein
MADIPDHGGTPDFRRPDPDPDPTDVPAIELLSGAESKEVLGWFLEHCEGCVHQSCEGCVLPHCDACCGDGGFAITDDDYDYLASLGSHDD